jgi:hypothetical protein
MQGRCQLAAVDGVYLAFLGLVDSRAPQLTELSHQLSTNH